MDTERLGAFYLGRRVDPQSGETGAEPVLYDAKDLTTHAVCVGMTGSGKTGLGVTLLEEAAIDGIPIVAIDPKGDLANLLLTFPALRPADFEPWIDPGDAARKGRSVAQHASATAAMWREGLRDWGQEPARIGRFAEACERRVLTPGSRAGLPVNVLGSLAAPPAALRDDAEALRERVVGAVSGLLGLLGLDADPLQSREHILLATLFERAWREGRDLDLATLIHQLQRPPVERVGVIDLESFFPTRERAVFAMRVNNLLASPGFELWLEGESLRAADLLFGPGGVPRLSIVSIAHLSDAERMFVVTQVLSELVSWMRTRPGSSSLRALLYMDEVFGYLPPIANPPSKGPMLTLLKQARAFGVGCVLATQNPVDLDYKALSNAGTWFLGRLQTERDKARVLDGLEGADAGASLDRTRVDALLSGLQSRVFLMHNVHEDEPVLYHTRWALSYLAGPMTREQIRALREGPADAIDERAPATTPAESVATPAPPPEAGPADVGAERPVVPAQVQEGFLPVCEPPGPGETLLYTPSLLAEADLHYTRASAELDLWRRSAVFAPLGARGADPWTGMRDLGARPELDAEPEAGAAFAPLGAAASRATSYTRWRKRLASVLYRERRLPLFRTRKPKLVSAHDETEDEFRARVRQALRETRDLKKEKLRARYAPKLRRVRDRIERAEARVEVEREQYDQRKTSSLISIGATVLGALFGRKIGSAGNVGRASTAARSVSRTAKERGDIGRAEEAVERVREELEAIETRFETDLEAVETSLSLDEVEVETLSIPLRKSDCAVEGPMVMWCPWRVDAGGRRIPAWSEAGWEPAGAET